MEKNHLAHDKLINKLNKQKNTSTKTIKSKRLKQFSLTLKNHLRLFKKQTIMYN